MYNDSNDVRVGLHINDIVLNIAFDCFVYHVILYYAFGSESNCKKKFFYILSTGSKAIPVLWQFFQTWDTPEKTRSADWQPIADLIQPLGLHTKRAKMLIQFSGKYEQEIRGEK